MYAYYVEVPRILISGSNFQFIPPVEFLGFFQIFVLAKIVFERKKCYYKYMLFGLVSKW